jgi:hypothetical protein
LDEKLLEDSPTLREEHRQTAFENKNGGLLRKRQGINETNPKENVRTRERGSNIRFY